MKLYFILAFLYLFAASGSDTPSKALEEYYAAINVQDTARTLALSTEVRKADLLQRLSSYFKMCHDEATAIHVTGETMVSDTEAVVTYRSIVRDRTTMEFLEAGTVECVMRKEAGIWKVFYCREPTWSMYTAKPIDDIPTCIAKVVAAINHRDSVAFYDAMCWEARELSESSIPTRALWDSLQGCTIGIHVTGTREFLHTVHREEDTARFAHAQLQLSISGRVTRQFNDLTAVLRVDSGHWKLATLSIDHTKPFHLE